MDRCFCKDPSVCPCRPACQKAAHTIPAEPAQPQRREPRQLTEEDVRRIAREEINRATRR